MTETPENLPLFREILEEADLILPSEVNKLDNVNRPDEWKERYIRWYVTKNILTYEDVENMQHVFEECMEKRNLIKEYGVFIRRPPTSKKRLILNYHGFKKVVNLHSKTPIPKHYYVVIPGSTTLDMPCLKSFEDMHHKPSKSFPGKRLEFEYNRELSENVFEYRYVGYETQ